MKPSGPRSQERSGLDAQSRCNPGDVVDGNVQFGELHDCIGNGRRPLGLCWNVLDPIVDLDCAPDEPRLVYHFGLLGLMTAEMVAKLHAGSASGWSGHDLSDRDVEEANIPDVVPAGLTAS